MTATVASEATADVPGACAVVPGAELESGETADVLRAVDSSILGGSTLLALTNNPYSTLARQADAVVGFPAGPEIGVAATKTFICQIIAGSAVMLSALVAIETVCHPRWRHAWPTT